MTHSTYPAGITALDELTESTPPCFAWASAVRPAPPDWSESLGARAVLAATLLGLVCACGSGGAGSSPKSADDTEETASTADESRDEPSDSDQTEESEPETSAPRASCDDGECFRCGDGVCLKGWYCDEGAQGGAACSWLPECATKGGCGCISRALGGACSCKDEDGAAHVTCR